MSPATDLSVHEQLWPIEQLAATATDIASTMEPHHHWKSLVGKRPVESISNNNPIPKK